MKTLPSLHSAGGCCPAPLLHPLSPGVKGACPHCAVAADHFCLQLDSYTYTHSAVPEAAEPWPALPHNHFALVSPALLTLFCSLPSSVLQAEPSQIPDPRHVWSRHSLPITDMCCGFGGPLARAATASLDQTAKVRLGPVWTNKYPRGVHAPEG